MSQTAITAVGLALGVLGSALIAIPDVRTLFSRFPAGALKEARNRMALIGVQVGDTGFELLRKLLNEIDCIAEFGADNSGKEYVEIQVNSLSGVQSDETYQHPEFNWGDRYVEARYEQDGGWDKTDFYDVEDVFDAIAARERPKTAQLRLYGLLILLCGFAFQLLATIEVDPIIPGLVALGILGACLGIYTYQDRFE